MALTVAEVFLLGIVKDSLAMVDELEIDAQSVTAAFQSGVRPVAQAPKASKLINQAQGQDRLSDAQLERIATDWATRQPRLVTARAGAVTEIANDLKYFSRTYFGDALNGTSSYDSAESWINSILSTGGTGVPIEAQVIARDQSRVSGEAARARSEIASEFVSRGLTLAPRVAQYQALNVALVSGDASGASERDTAIHRWEIEVDTTQWSIERALTLRAEAMTQVGNYITEWLKLLYARANQAEQEVIDRQTALQDTYFKFMQQELALRSNAIDRYLVSFDESTRRWKSREELNKTLLTMRNKQLQAHAQALASRAASSINSLNVSVTAGAQESV